MNDNIRVKLYNIRDRVSVNIRVDAEFNTGWRQVVSCLNAVFELFNTNTACKEIDAFKTNDCLRRHKKLNNIERNITDLVRSINFHKPLDFCREKRIYKQNMQLT